MRGHDLFRFAAVIACLLCYLTIILGGNVMASDNGLACPDWPSCFGNGNFFPALQGGVALEWGHRLGAFFLSLSTLVLALLGVAYERGRRALMRMSLAALALVITEALLGAVVVESRLDTPFILVHLGIATALFGLLLVTALLANLREMPRRWIEWARQAADESPPGAPADLPEPYTPFGGEAPVARRPREG